LYKQFKQIQEADHECILTLADSNCYSFRLEFADSWTSVTAT